MTAKQLKRLLTELGASQEAVQWAEGKNLRDAWNTCERPDWMLSLCDRMAGRRGWPTREQVVLAACDCAERALRFVPPDEDRPRKAIETVRKWAEGRATLDEVREAADAARTAAVKAVARPAGAGEAGWAARAAASGATGAWWVPGAAVVNAADAAWAAAAVAAGAEEAGAELTEEETAAAEAAETAELKVCADIVRNRLSVPMDGAK